MQVRYMVHTLSARAIIGYAKENKNGYTFHLNRSATEKCFVRNTANEQEDNALFYQTMCVLHDGNFTLNDGQKIVSDLADVIFYVDFSGIFDRGSSNRYLDRQNKAEAMFRPEGITLDFGSGEHNYLAFERSGSMSRQAKMSFIRADVYDEVRRRIMMDMTITNCQLSKLYAYNGLMLSGGVRIDGIDIAKSHRVIIVENPIFTINARVITVEGEHGNSATKKYHRV